MLENSSEPESETTEPPAEPPESYFSRSEAARYLGVPVSTIYHWARTGRLPYVLTLGGHMRFPRTALDAVNVRRPRLSRWSQPQPPPKDPCPAVPDRQA
jgi:excisionase family DNA binding protein